MIHLLDNSLFTDLRDFANEHSQKLFEQKVRWVHTKCLRRGKTELARRIALKYGKIIDAPFKDDRVMAFVIALAAQNKKV